MDVKQNSGEGRTICSPRNIQSLPEPECLFYSSVQKMTQVKIKLEQFLDLR
jgi:hypothetical protein